MSTEENKAAIRRWVEEAWNRGNIKIADEIYASDYVLHRTGSPALIRGTDGLKDMVTNARSAFPDVHWTIDEQVAEGDKVAWRWTFRGTHLGPLGEITPTGKPITVTGIEISLFANGKIVEEWAVTDQLGMMQQLGEIPAPGARR